MKNPPRLEVIVKALPLQPNMRVLEIGGGPGAVARAIAHLIMGSYVGKPI